MGSRLFATAVRPYCRSVLAPCHQRWQSAAAAEQRLFARSRQPALFRLLQAERSIKPEGEERLRRHPDLLALGQDLSCAARRGSGDCPDGSAFPATRDAPKEALAIS